MNILFVCTGNTCRSPMAEAILKDKAPDINVKSAGVFAAENAPASPQVSLVLDQLNIELQHRSQLVTESLLEWADLVLTMTEGHRELLLNNFPKFSQKYFSLIQYTRENKDGNTDIADPFGGNLALYEETAEELEQYIDILLEKIKK